MRTLLKLILFGIVAFAASAEEAEQPERPTLNRAAALKDLSELEAIILEAHYDPFAYTSEKNFSAAYKRETEYLKSAEITPLNVHASLQRFAVSLNNGHTDIFFPIQSYLSHADKGGLVFPLEVALEDGKALVRANYSDQNQIPLGAELLSINGLPVQDILAEIRPQLSAESLYFKNTKIELFSLPRLYWQVFGAEQSFDVVMRFDGAESQQSLTLKGVPAIDGFEAVREDIIASRQMLNYPEDHVAYLNPGAFSGDEKAFQDFIDTSFADMKAKKVEVLIIDLRNNGGGNDSFSDYMVSYIADRPFQWNSSFHVKTSRYLKEHTQRNGDITSRFSQAILSHEDGERFAFQFDDTDPQAPSKRFNGEVYVLVNRQSHSQAAVTAAQIQDYGWATIVGEETAEYPSLLASIFQVTLPNSGLVVNVSKGQIVRVSGDQSHVGVVPDIRIKDHLLDDDDEILAGLLERLSANSRN